MSEEENSMKAILWEQCLLKGSSAPTKSGMRLNFPETVEIGMQVTAKYRDVTVGLDILGDYGTETYSAKVKFFEPPLSALPDLAIGDMVTISRDKICWLHGKG